MLEVRCHTEEDSVVFELEGDMSGAAAPLLARCLDAAMEIDTRQLVVDLTGVTLFQEAGLNVLASRRRQCEATGRTMSLRSAHGTTPSILELFEVA